MGLPAPIPTWINPDAAAKTHAQTATGMSDNKFGIRLTTAAQVHEAAAMLPHIREKGVRMHTGSSLTVIARLVEAVKKLVPLVQELKEAHDLDYFPTIFPSEEGSDHLRGCVGKGGACMVG